MAYTGCVSWDQLIELVFFLWPYEKAHCFLRALQLSGCVQRKKLVFLSYYNSERETHESNYVITRHCEGYEGIKLGGLGEKISETCLGLRWIDRKDTHEEL